MLGDSAGCEPAFLRGHWPAVVFAVAIIAATALGCGGGGATGTSGAGGAVVIYGDPGSQTVPIGVTATFTVAAYGAAPLSYQWSKNGTQIAGAASSTYATPPIALSDSGATYAATVSNAYNSVVSSAATLTAGPRSPKQGDLRFQQVDAASTAIVSPGPGGVGTDIRLTYANATGSPLSIASGIYTCQPGVYNCGWGFSVNPLPPGQSGLTMYYFGHDYPSFESDWQATAAPNVVLTSLDFQPGSFAYGASWIQTAQIGGFDYRQEIVGAANIQSQASHDAAQSRVVTAISFDAHGQANLFSYGWTGDTITVYDAKAVFSNPDNIVTDAKSLAAEGYILTAFGGDDANGYVLVGTKVEGDTLPREVLIVDGSSSISTSLDGYSTVANFKNGTTGYYAFILER